MTSFQYDKNLYQMLIGHFKILSFLHADIEDSDQMARLIQVFTKCKAYIIDFVM